MSDANSIWPHFMRLEGDAYTIVAPLIISWAVALALILPQRRKCRPKESYFQPIPSIENSLDTRDHHEGRRKLRELFRFARAFVGILGTVLVVAFAYLKINWDQVGEMLGQSETTNILQATLFVTYFSWIWGINFDISMLEDVYFADPSHGEVSLWGYSAAAVFVVSTFSLLLGVSNEKHLALALTLFSAICLWFLLILGRRINPIVGLTYSVYSENQNEFGIEQLNIVDTYERGRWIWTRQITLLTMLLIVDFICLVDAFRAGVVKLIGMFVGGAVPAYVEHFMPIVALLIFLLAAEGSQWIMRLKTKISIHVLNELSDRYYLQTKADIPKA